MVSPSSPLEAVAQAITKVLNDHVRIKHDQHGSWCECGAEWNIKQGHNAHVAAAVAAALELREETREQENFPYGLEIGISTYAGQGHADCNKCNISEYGCYADLVKWSHNHAKEKHDWTGSTFEHRWVSSWTSGSEGRDA